MNIKAKIVTFAGAIALLSGGAAAEEIKIGLPNWVTAAITGEIINYIASNDLGYKSSSVPGTNPVIFKAMGLGTGDIDIHPEVWLPNQANLAKQYVEEAGTVALAANPFEVRQGVCTTRYTAETLGIKSVYDLANAELSAKFDTDGNGRGEFWPGAHGFASTNVEMVKAREYGYDQFWDLVPTDESIHLSNMDKAANENKFYLGQCQQTHHIFALHDLVWLEEPPYDAEAWHMIQPSEDPEWFEKSKVATAWPPSDIHIAYSKSLESRAPELVDLLNRIQLDADLVGLWSLMVIADGLTPEQAAKKWVDENRSTVDGWLGL
ncbi:glycine betaine ABC transporter substrate-binding protein [Aquamicrobium defluvii]|uniref:Glycine/betaine ABC transporter substrate-binding protein n=1 Tax=Aquamicrobium defluvii TaxID=69279 RepID=A0A011UGE5_9HYPH|nr:glycine betaine ABC transporter substrate-binding protein [Aquamicrobium defluvii]EXL04928.1 glycine/betaine ABC transporter substrate-binding protein [Aquamicrobium defluvii]EZQ14558.1 glycine/betaine ABC transporter substrate-binding protein [Halopseudomonas bauzanensis]